METAIMVSVFSSLVTTILGFCFGYVIYKAKDSGEKFGILGVLTVFTLAIMMTQFKALNEHRILELDNNLGRPISWQALAGRGFVQISVPIRVSYEGQRHDKNLAVVQGSNAEFLLVQFDSMPTNRIARVSTENGITILKDKGPRQSQKTVEVKPGIILETDGYLATEKSLRP